MKTHSWDEAVGRDSFAQYLQLQRRYDAELRKALEKAAREASRIIAAMPKDTFSQRTRMSLYQMRLFRIADILNGLWGNMANITENSMRRAATAGADATTNLAKTLGRSVPKSSLLLSGFQQAADRSAANVQARFINSINLSPRVYKNAAWSRGRVDDAINNGISLGKSAKEIASDVKGMISARTPGGVSFAAFRLGRTEINNAYHTVQTQSYATQPWITGVQWKNSGSHPRPDVCDLYATEDHVGLGKGVFEKGNVPRKPHPQCLCHVIAITESREDFVDNLMAGNYNSYISFT